MLRITIPEISTEQMLYNHLTNIMVVDISELPIGGFFPLYNDALDVGIRIRSHKTGRVYTYYLDEVAQTDDGDIVQWVLRPISEENRPDLPTLIVFND